MKALRYTLILLLMMGFTHDQCASHSALSFEVGPSLPDGSRVVYTSSGGVYSRSKKYFDESGNLTDVAKKDIQDYELHKTGRVVSRDQQLRTPVVSALKKQSKQGASSSVAAPAKKIVKFAPKTDVKHYAVYDGIEHVPVDYEVPKEIAYNADFRLASGEPVTVIDEKKFVEPYIGGSSVNARSGAFTGTTSDERRQASAQDSWRRYAQADLYIEDEALGHVDAVMDDLSRIWIDKFGKKYKLDRTLFDSAGNLTIAGRERLIQAQQQNMRQSAIQATHQLSTQESDDDSGDDDRKDVVVRRDQPESSLQVTPVSQWFSSSDDSSAVQAANSERIVTPEFVIALQSMSDEQLRSAIPKIVSMPAPVKVLHVDDLSVQDLDRIFHHTIDLAGTITADFLDKFFKVQCADQQTLDVYVQWLNQRLSPLIMEFLRYRQKSVEDYYLKARNTKQELAENDRDRVQQDLMHVEATQRRTYYQDGVALAATVAVPVVVSYSETASKHPVFKNIFYGSCLVLVAVELKMMFEALDRLGRKKSGLVRDAYIAENAVTGLHNLPKSLPQGTLDVFNQNLGSFYSTMQGRIERLAQEESTRIKTELEKLQQSAQTTPAIEAQLPSSHGSSDTAASAASPGVSWQHRAWQGASRVLNGINWVSTNLKR